MARGVGNLNVSVTANTARGNANLKKFQAEVKATAEAARNFSRGVGSLVTNQNDAWQKGLAVLADQNGAWKDNAKSARAAATAGEEFRSSVVDLRRDTDRYNGDLQRTTALTKQLDKAFKGLKAIGKIAIPISVFMAGVGAGKKLGDMLFGGDGTIGERFGRWFEETFDPALAANRRKKQEALARGDSERAQKAHDDKKAAEEAKRQRDEAFTAAREENRIRMIGVEQGEAAAQFERDKNEHGQHRAALLAQERAALESAERHKQTIREKAEAKAEQQRREQLANERRHQQRLKQQQETQRRDAEQLAELRERLRTFGMSNADRERDRILGGINDSGARGEAAGLLARLDRLEQMQATLDKNRQTLAGRRDPDALDARTGEGWAALRKNMQANDPARQMVERQQRQIDLHIRTNELLAEQNRQQPQVFNPS